jgi:hypothetical protein
MLKSPKTYHLKKYIYIIEGSLEVKLPAIWTDGKAEVGRVREENVREKIREEKGIRKKIKVRKKGRNVAKYCVFANVLGLWRVEK